MKRHDQVIAAARAGMAENSEIHSWKYRILFVTPFIGYVLLVFPFINQLPMHEEIVHLRDTSSWETALGYWYHPPLYVIIGKLAKITFGNSYHALYMLGIFFMFLNIFIVMLILKRLSLAINARERLRWVLMGMWMFAIMPIAVHGSILLEMESTVLTPLCLFTFYYYLRNVTYRNSIRFRVCLGILFALTMWAKYFFTPFLLIGAIFLYEWKSSKLFFKTMKDSAVTLVTALSVFVPSYLLYSYLFLPSEKNSFIFLLTSRYPTDIPLLLSGKLLLPVLSKITAFISWFSPFFIILFLSLIYKMIRAWKEFSYERLILLSIALIFAFYFLAHFYPFAESKYFYPAFPLIAILTTTLMRKNEIVFPPCKYLLVLPLIVLCMYFSIADPLYTLLLYYRENQPAMMLFYTIKYVLISSILFCILFLIFYKAIQSRRNAFFSSLAYLTLSAWLALFANQAVGQYQTKYQYGEVGAKKVIQYIQSEISQGSKIILPDDINYYTNTKFRKKGSIFLEFQSRPEDWDVLVERKVNILRLSMNAIGILNKKYELNKQIGSYQVFKRKTEEEKGR